jgi:hypothetical protein
MDQGGQATRAYPQAGAGFAAGKQYALVFAGSAHVAALLDVRFLSGGHLALGSTFVKGGCFPLFDAQSAGGTDGQAETCSVAEFVADHVRFAIYDLDGSLGTWGYAQPASVAQLLINAHDLSFHVVLLWVVM